MTPSVLPRLNSCNRNGINGLWDIVLADACQQFFKRPSWFDDDLAINERNFHKRIVLQFSIQGKRFWDPQGEAVALSMNLCVHKLLSCP